MSVASSLRISIEAAPLTVEFWQLKNKELGAHLPMLTHMFCCCAELLQLTLPPASSTAVTTAAIHVDECWNLNLYNEIFCQNVPSYIELFNIYKSGGETSYICICSLIWPLNSNLLMTSSMRLFPFLHIKMLYNT